MPVRINAPLGMFKINAPIGRFIIASGVTINRGDKLKFIDSGDTTYITNDVSNDEVTTAISLGYGTAGSTILCYVLSYKNKHRDLKQSTHSSLESYTYKELTNTYLYGIK